MKNLLNFLASIAFVFGAVNTSSAQLADLVVTSVRVGSMSASSLKYSGDEITVPIEIVIQNVGKADIKNNFGNYIGVKLGKKEIYHIVTQKGLRAGRRAKLRVSIKLPESMRGTTLRFSGVADNADETIGLSPVKESNEKNNSKTALLKIPTFFKIGEDAPIKSPIAN